MPGGARLLRIIKSCFPLIHLLYLNFSSASVWYYFVVEEVVVIIGKMYTSFPSMGY